MPVHGLGRFSRHREFGGFCELGRFGGSGRFGGLMAKFNGSDRLDPFRESEGFQQLDEEVLGMVSLEEPANKQIK